MTGEEFITGADAVLAALEDAGITHLFVNLGSDHPAFIAAFASKRYQNLRIITSPNEMNALSAASGFSQITGRPAAVLVHVECGTQGLGAAVHNISKGRIPAFIFAGTSPITMEGEEVGSRNEYIHWIQDVPDQRAIVRQYMKFEHEIRSPHNAAQLTLRALQHAVSSPQGPTYLVASREALEAETRKIASKPSQLANKNSPVEPIGLSPLALTLLSAELSNAKRPLIVTSYCGRSSEGFEALRDLAEFLVIPVHENAPIWNNFQQHRFCIKAINGMGVVNYPNSQKPMCDPLKTSMTLWSLPCEKHWQCDSGLALQQLLSHIQQTATPKSPEAQSHMKSRRKILQARFARRKERLQQKELLSINGGITVPFFMSRFREATSKLLVVALNESTTNLPNVADHLHHDRPQTLIGSGGGGLGWWSGAAVGAHMGLQTLGRRDVLVAFTGDGTWIFGIPTSAYWMAKKYQTPYLTVIWNNGGWAAPRAACLRVHGHLASQESLTEDVGVGIQPSPDFGKIAEGAGDAWTTVVERGDEVDEALKEALRVINAEKRCAVIEVRLEKI